MILTGPSWVYEFDGNVVADAFDQPVFPAIQRVGRSGVAIPVLVPFIRRAKHNVDAAAVRSPTRYRRLEVIIGVLDAPVVFFFVFIFGRPRSGVPA